MLMTQTRTFNYWRAGARELSQTELAEMAGVTQSAISLLERGKRRPSPKLARKIASALGVRPQELFGADCTRRGALKRTYESQEAGTKAGPETNAPTTAREELLDHANTTTL